MVTVRARERQLALPRRQSHARPHRHRAIRSARGQGHAHIHAAALPRSTPAEPTLAISDCEAAPAGSTARAPARRLRCRALTRRVSGNQVTGGSRAHVANCTHAQGFLGRPQPLPGSTDSGVSHRRRAPSTFNTTQELELDRHLISGARSWSHWRTDGLSRGERRPGSGSEAPVHLLGRDGRYVPTELQTGRSRPSRPRRPDGSTAEAVIRSE